MKLGNPKQKMYTDGLKKTLIKQSKNTMSEQEAEIGAIEITKTLLKAGDSLDLKTIQSTAKWVVAQKTRFDDGELVYVPGEQITDTITGEKYTI